MPERYPHARIEVMKREQQLARAQRKRAVFGFMIWVTLVALFLGCWWLGNRGGL